METLALFLPKNTLALEWKCGEGKHGAAGWQLQACISHGLLLLLEHDSWTEERSSLVTHSLGLETAEISDASQLCKKNSYSLAGQREIS